MPTRGCCCSSSGSGGSSSRRGTCLWCAIATRCGCGRGRYCRCHALRTAISQVLQRRVDGAAGGGAVTNRGGTKGGSQGRERPHGIQGPHRRQHVREEERRRDVGVQDGSGSLAAVVSSSQGVVVLRSEGKEADGRGGERGHRLHGRHRQRNLPQHQRRQSVAVWRQQGSQ